MIIARRLGIKSVNMAARSVSLFSKETILSEENREKTIEAMRNGGKIEVPPKVKGTRRDAAVLIPICVDKNDQISLLYTVRSSNLKRHVGEVSFPGGVKDETDADYIECALRETEEEIGIPRHKVNVWGVGQSILPYSNFVIHPVVGVIENFEDCLPLKLSPDEVEEYFLVPLEHLCDEANQQYTHFRAGYSIPAYVNAHAKIWGITAVITHLFLTALLPPEAYSFNVPKLKKFKL